MNKINKLAIEYSRETFVNPALTYKRELCVKGFTAGFEHVVNELKNSLSPEELIILENIINENVIIEKETSTFNGAEHE